MAATATRKVWMLFTIDSEPGWWLVTHRLAGAVAYKVNTEKAARDLCVILNTAEATIEPDDPADERFSTGAY